MNKIKIKKKIKSFLNSKKDLLVSPKKKFNTIYLTNHWGDLESISGPGSKVEVTETVRKEFSALLKKFNIKSIVDAPCGDFNWMKLVDLTNVKYCGIDIVEELVSENNKKYAKEGIKFIFKNILEDELPKAELILCRDCLAHFSNGNVHKAIKSFVKSGSKYLLTTSYTETIENFDIVTGGWRKINLLLPPFNFPEPIYIIDEKAPDHIENGRNKDKTLHMWELDELMKSFMVNKERHS